MQCAGGQTMVMGIVNDVVQSDCPFCRVIVCHTNLFPPQIVNFLSK